MLAFDLFLRDQIKFGVSSFVFAIYFSSRIAFSDKNIVVILKLYFLCLQIRTIFLVESNSFWWKIISKCLYKYLVSSARILTHNLSIMGLLLLPLDQVSYYSSLELLRKWRCTTRHYYYLSGLLAFCSFFEEMILFIPMLLDTYFKLRARKASYKTNWSGVRALAQKGNAFLTWI